MRILHVLPSFTRALGDPWRLTRQIIKHLADRGHEITLIGADGPDAKVSAGDFSCQVLPFQGKRTKRDLYFTPHMIDWARQNVKTYDLIHLHGVRSFQNNLVRHYAIRHSIPYLISPHGSLDQTRLNTWRVVTPEKQVNLQTLAAASLILPSSNLERQELLEAQILSQRLKLLVPGIEIAPANIEAVNQYRQVRGWTDGRLGGLYLGRSDPKAGIHHLLRAYQRLQNRLPELQLLIEIQEADDLEEWQRRADQLDVGQSVVFCASLTEDERALAITAADVVVATDRNPAVEMAPLEALMCGTPVVVSKACGAGEMLQPSGGAYFFPASDVEVLAVGLLQALTEARNTKERIELGQKFVKTHFNWNDVIDRLEKLYLDTLQLHLDPAALKVSEPAQSS